MSTMREQITGKYQNKLEGHQMPDRHPSYNSPDNLQTKFFFLYKRVIDFLYKCQPFWKDASG
jgi:hypothetical protein